MSLAGSVPRPEPVESAGLLLRRLASTALVVAFIVIPLAAGAVRFSAPRFGLFSLIVDVVVGAWMVLAVISAIWLFSRFLRPAHALKRIPLIPAIVQSAVGEIVEVSSFGVGRLTGWSKTGRDGGLDRLDTDIVIDVPIFGSAEAPSDEARRSPGAERPRSRPAKRAATEPMKVDPGPLVERSVGRGETFWSLAEAVYGDGRRWPELLELNRDREVTPGVVLTDGVVLRSGWTVLVPDPEARSS